MLRPHPLDNRHMITIKSYGESMRKEMVGKSWRFEEITALRALKLVTASMLLYYYVV
jgi:hypothetical protein